MDIFIRIIIMIICSIIISYIATNIYMPLNDLDKKEKIYMYIFYGFFINWFIITPSIVFFECFKYILGK